MNLFILAAGKGTRLYPLTKNQPKSLIKLDDGSTILERQLDVAQKSGLFDKIYVISGYLSHMIESVAERYDNVEIIFNPYYDVSNNLFSLWTAHYLFLEKDFVVSNGDNVYKQDIYDAVSASSADRENTIQLTIDKKESYDDDDMKVTLDVAGHVTRVSKQIPLEDADCESLGLVMIKGQEARKTFYEKVMQLVRDPDMMNMFWLEIFNAMIRDDQKLDTCEVSHKDWAEMDFHPDVESLQKAISANIF